MLIDTFVLLLIVSYPFFSLIIYTGLCFVSIKILPKYSPMIPKDRSCMPPKKRMTIMSVGKPCTGSPNMMVLKKCSTYRKMLKSTR